MLDAPWLSAEKRGLVTLLLTSHQRAFGRPLIAAARAGQSMRLCCQDLFVCGFPVLSHGIGSDPTLTYANAAALQLWERRWDQLVGMPSRMTAPAEARQERQQALNTAQMQDAIWGYGGVRINGDGRRFMIRNARIWTLWDEEERSCGQAACFSDWWYL
ncbi:MAG: MEKHLA domain-containing protein [Cyanobacteriota bacterium]|nr:MEKHLA domain-containing protein [Cyanobacteriota bacterium]